MRQLDLILPSRSGTKDDRLAELVEVLHGRGWVRSSVLHGLGFGDRELRDLVEHDVTGQILSYPGSPGYKAFADATIQEVERAETLRSQARAMIRRWLRYQHRRHGRAA